MEIVSIRLDPENVDDVRLIIKGDVPQIIKLKDRETAYKLNMDVWTLYYMVHSDHDEEFALEIDEIIYMFPLKVCHEIMDLLCDQWLGDFIDAEYPDGPPEDPPELRNLSFKERVALIEQSSDT